MAAQPHGGRLVRQTLKGRRGEEVKARAGRLPAVKVDDQTLFEAEKIAVGAFSPLRGFMGREELEHVLKEMRLPDGTVWTLPILLLVEEGEFEKAKGADEVLLADGRGRPHFLLKLEDAFKVDLLEVARLTYGTDSKDHPGVAMLLRHPPYALAGEVWMLKRPFNPHRCLEMDPEEVRAEIRRRGWRTVVGFQTRNPPHRAHEYLQKCALEVADGLLIQPILGEKKPDDFSCEAIIEAYKVLVENYFPKERVLLSGLTIRMRYAGPREAVFHAIVRKNYGCTHFIVGRDHAGAGGFYDPYAAHRIFDELPPLGIEIIKAQEAFFCRRCPGMASEKTCPHSGEERLSISMTALRRMLREGKMPPPEVMRPEVARVLMEVSAR